MERLDRLLSWTPQLEVDEGVASELSALRKLENPILAARRRTQHLEWHEAQGDAQCECYERAIFPHVLPEGG